MENDFLLKRMTGRGSWVAQLVECLTLGFGSGRDRVVVGWSRGSGSALSEESAWDPSPSALLLLSARSVCLSIK